MQYKKDTSFEQLHVLWMRMWDFMATFIRELDGNEVQEAIQAVKDPNHPFYAKLKEALQTLRLKLKAELSERRWIVDCNNRLDHRETLQWVRNDPETHMRFSVSANDEFDLLFDSDKKDTQSVQLRILFFNCSLNTAEAIAIAARHGFKVAPPEYCLYLIQDFLGKSQDSEFYQDGHGSSILFVDPQNTKRALETKYGSMGGIDVKEIKDSDFGFYGIAVIEKVLD